MTTRATILVSVNGKQGAQRLHCVETPLTTEGWKTAFQGCFGYWPEDDAYIDMIPEVYS